VVIIVVALAHTYLVFAGWGSVHAGWWHTEDGNVFGAAAKSNRLRAGTTCRRRRRGLPSRCASKQCERERECEYEYECLCRWRQ
jgi:hypothetical protein